MALPFNVKKIVFAMRGGVMLMSLFVITIMGIVIKITGLVMPTTAVAM